MKVLVAARPYDLSDAPADVFVTRHLDMVRALAEHATVEVAGLRPAGDEAVFAEAVRGQVRGEVTLPTEKLDPGLHARLRAGRRLVHEPLDAWEHSLAELADGAAADVVVTVGPWLDVAYRVLFAEHPSVHLHEEDLTTMPELAPQSRQARLLRSLEDLGRRRAGMKPDAVVVISEPELAAARRRYPGVWVVHLPYTLDPAEWPVATTSSRGERVLVVGNLANERNSEGLLDVLREIDDRSLGGSLDVRLVSAAGLARPVQPYADRSWVTYEHPVTDVRSEYQQAAVALVPSTRATGFKTTILQAWSCGCPVVCFPASAATLGDAAQSAVVVGDTAAAVVDRLLDLRGDETARQRLAAAGLALASSQFSRASEAQKLLTLVERVASSR